ncbi:MAG: glycosyltransferase family 39 protein [Gemmataceae bacterium]|nr:glycosyltransferase family 39 protein [Gemmataceae bacterium]
MSTVFPPPTAATPTPARPLPAWLSALRSPADHPRLCVLILLVWCAALFFYGLGAGELWRTEGLRAIIAAEFLHSGNWVVPTLYGEPLFTKPPGTYAAIALCSLPFGSVTEFSARLPSALAATAVVFLFYWYFTRQLGRRAGLVAALLVPVGFMWVDKASSAEIDMLQVAWVSAALLFFFRALEEEENCGLRIADCGLKAGGAGQRVEAYRVRADGATITVQEGPGQADPRLVSAHPQSAIRNPQSQGWWLAALLCVAGGVLTKWTAPAFFYATAVTLLWWRGRLRLLLGWPHLLSAAVAAGVCLAWAVAAGTLGGWANLTSTVEREAFQRLVPNYTPRPYPWLESLLHPLRLLATTLPLSVLALLTLRPGFSRLWDERGRRLLQALHCWAWPNVLLWSLPTEHTPRHSFPLFPAIAGLAAMVWVAWLAGKLPWRYPRLAPAKVLVAALVVWLGVKVAFVHAIVPLRNANREPRAKGELLAALVPPGRTLYLFQLKDEGIMFYYGRPVIRLEGPERLPCGAGPMYCILTEEEWSQWGAGRPVEALRHLTDEQGDPIVLARVGE